MDPSAGFLGPPQGLLGRGLDLWHVDADLDVLVAAASAKDIATEEIEQCDHQDHRHKNSGDGATAATARLNLCHSIFSFPDFQSPFIWRLNAVARVWVPAANYPRLF